MAPPSPRRPGFSRRAQYGIFASYVIAVAGIILALLLALTARFDPQGHSALQSMVSDITSPLSSVGRTVVNGVRGAGDSVSAYFNAASKNKAMERELKAARLKLIKGQVDAVENARLKRVLSIVEKSDHPVITAQLISSTGSSSRRYAMLSIGAAGGIENGQPVRAPEGLVGRIVQVGQISSRILLIVDAGNNVPVKRLSDNMPALAVGIGDGNLDIRPLAAGMNPFKRGDIFVTSGSGGIYAPGIPVARCIKQSRAGTLARPLADPSRLDFAIIEPVFATPLPTPVGLSGSEHAAEGAQD
jgi:rod shape-determining protein MreC